MTNVLNFQTHSCAGKINATAAEAFEMILKGVSELPAPYDFLPTSLSTLHESMGTKRALVALDLSNISVTGTMEIGLVTFKAWNLIVDKDLDLEKLSPYLTIAINMHVGSARVLPKVEPSAVLQSALDSRRNCSHLVEQEDETADELFVILSTLRYFAERGTMLNWHGDLFTMNYSFLVNSTAPDQSLTVDIEVNWMEGFDYHRRLNEYLQRIAHDELSD